METKHTPGPWISSSFGFQVLGDKGRVSVCQLDGKQREEIQKANAKLIAAAPEMLEALKSIVDYWETPKNGSLHSHILHSLEVAETAIKKATEP